MANYIGTLGGLLMIALIVVLFFRFLMDIGVDKNKIYRKQIGGFALPALILAVLQLTYGALVSNFVYDIGTVFDINSIWTMKPVSDTNPLVTAYSFSEVTGKGAMPLYYLITGAFAGVLYEMYDQCALYISMLSGIVTYAALGMIIARTNSESGNDSKITEQMFVLLLCLPGSIFLFLPSGFSLGTALLSVFLYVWNGGKGNIVLSVIMAILCCITHLSGLCAIAVIIAGYIYRPEGKWALVRDLAAITIAQLAVVAICVAGGWGSLPEYVIILGIVAVLGINNLKIQLNHMTASLVNMLMVLINGFWITGMLYGVM